MVFIKKKKRVKFLLKIWYYIFMKTTNGLIYLENGENTTFQGSGKKPYVIKKIGGVISCSCPAWLNMGLAIETRACKHIKKAIDPACWPKEALERAGMLTTLESSESDQFVASILPSEPVRYTKTGKISTAIKGGAVKKDTAPPVLLAHEWDDEQDVIGWYCSNKLDGVRAWWNGSEFISRLGNTFNAPQWFKDAMPQGIILDGELFVGNGQFRKTISTVSKLIPNDSEWKNLQYMVFDLPTHGGIFEERMEDLRKILPVEGRETRYVDMVEHYPISGEDLGQAVEDQLSLAEKYGYEGIMLRQPGSFYVEGRSNTLLKLKRYYDEEATVIEHIPGRGKHKGRMGAIRIQLDDGTIFKLGTGFTDKDRENPPKIGSRITFHYTEKNADTGKAKCAGFTAIRDYE